MTEDELGVLIEKYSDLAYTVISSILGQNRRQDIEECLSDVFFDLYRMSCGADKIGKNLVITVSRRKAIDRLRYINRHGGDLDIELNEELADAGFTDDIADRINKYLIAEAINALPEKDAEIFTRRYYYGQSLKEIAIAMSVNVKFVQNRLYLSKKTLCEYLKRNGINM